MNLKSLVCFGAVLLLAGCSTPTHVDHGVIHGRTFSFINSGIRPEAVGSDTRPAVHRVIQDAITRDLAAHGIAKVDAGADLQVGYLVIIGNNGYTESINDYFGYSEDATALHEKAQAAYTSSKNRNYFEAGTLVIDLVDARTSKLLKRGYATRPTLRNIPEDARAAKIQEVVHAILSDLRTEQ